MENLHRTTEYSLLEIYSLKICIMRNYIIVYKGRWQNRSIVVVV